MAVYTSGDWHVKPGREQDFVDAWREMAEWSTNEYGPNGWGKLLRDKEEVMTGEEFLRSLRHDRRSSLPVIVCSVDGPRAEHIRGIGDIQGVFVKGRQKEELVNLISNVVASGSDFAN